MDYHYATYDVALELDYMAQRLGRGVFIALEAPDGAGKSTQAKMLAESVSKYSPVRLTKEAGGTIIGSDIRRIAIANNGATPLTRLFLFLADRCQHVHEVILPCLNHGEHVICDRYHWSTLVYQGDTVDNVEQLSLQACQEVTPDLTIYLNVPSEVRWERLQQRGKLDHFETDFLEADQKLVDRYSKLISHSDFDSVLCLSCGNLSADHVHSILILRLLDKLKLLNK